MNQALMIRVLVVLALAVLIVGAVATWRGQKEPPSQPHVPGWPGTPQR
jgi:hypothetical protein